MDLWHKTEVLLTPGDVISRGRWGSTVMQNGERHHYFFREMLLELWRAAYTKVPVSRLDCTFAFEDEACALDWAADEGARCYRVEPVDAAAASVRLDMLWITWMGEAGNTFEKTASFCRRYWDGVAAQEVKQSASTTWEWLFACDLRVISESAAAGYSR